MSIAAREANDPHMFFPDGTCYCPVSRRTEGTRHMRGERCSGCGYSNPEVPRP